MVQIRHFVTLFVLFTLSACSFAPGCSSHVYDKPHVFVNNDKLHDVEVVYAGGDYSWLDSATLADHVTNAFAHANEFWGGDADDLNGWTIQLMQQHYTCLGRHFYGDFGSGCTNWMTKTMYLYINPGSTPCFETSVFAHELGHVVHPWDFLHTNGHFHHFEPLWDTLRNDAATPAACRPANDPNYSPTFMWEHTVGL